VRELVLIFCWICGVQTAALTRRRSEVALVEVLEMVLSSEARVLLVEARLVRSGEVVEDMACLDLVGFGSKCCEWVAE
jgi:hypothetical protein